MKHHHKSPTVIESGLTCVVEVVMVKEVMRLNPRGFGVTFSNYEETIGGFPNEDFHG